MALGLHMNMIAQKNAFRASHVERVAANSGLDSKKQAEFRNMLLEYGRSMNGDKLGDFMVSQDLTTRCRILDAAEGTKETAKFAIEDTIRAIPNVLLLIVPAFMCAIYRPDIAARSQNFALGIVGAWAGLSYLAYRHAVRSYEKAKLLEESILAQISRSIEHLDMRNEQRYRDSKIQA